MVLKKKNKEFYLQNVYSFVRVVNNSMGDYKYETIKKKRFVINKNYLNFTQIEQLTKRISYCNNYAKAKEHHKILYKY